MSLEREGSLTKIAQIAQNTADIPHRLRPSRLIHLTHLSFPAVNHFGWASDALFAIALD